MWLKATNRRISLMPSPKIKAVQEEMQEWSYEF